ncbi:MAG: hypothetical protein QF492_04100 [Candidatus Krumholzibacteria bacterium]|jgi:hypothetical protein|nr:hypothetical protein [Candidatus Krumholzibacteria bacterium]MDP6669078.1 hypothetical protein [Candidatus Krumholzibacteria bacterium]MDP6796703.1 hypothetical protein [Candidatus Krumholzibacteria bacterium]MDP7021908.1 hypothetical protein [Candidatus Krumholzibacteria bacterium]
MRSYLFLILTYAISVSAEPLLNEVLYDPEGTDSGKEFVELIGEPGLGLQDFQLEFCNGSTPGQWQPLWQGEEGDSIPFSGFALIRSERLLCSLQNGPDALRLSRNGEVLDLLGYGTGLDSGLSETLPAKEASSGKSLGRRPDGVDTDQNILDWFSCEASPGRANWPDLQFRLGEPDPLWIVPEPGHPWSLSLEVENSGRLDWTEGLLLSAENLTESLLPPLASGSLFSASLLFPAMEEGYGEVLLRAVLPGEELEDSLLLPYKVGVGPLLMSELLFAPDSDEGEWLECVILEEADPLEEYRLEDLSGSGAEFYIPLPLENGSFLLCEDRTALLWQRPELDASRIVEVRPWPSLRNEGESPEMPPWTEGLRIRDARGRLIDGLLYRGDWILEKGQSLERRHLYPPAGLSAWAASPLLASPLDPSFPLLDDQDFDEVTPLAFNPLVERAEFRFHGVAGDRQLLLFDAAGRPVQQLRGSQSSGLLCLLWDGKDREGRVLPDGAYPWLLVGEGAEKKGLCLIRSAVR